MKEYKLSIAPMTAPVLVIACGAIARELVRIRDLNHWEHIEFQCLPAELHNTPDRIPQAVRAKIESAASRFKKVFVAYADCGTGGMLDQVIGAYGIERIPGAHCYEFYAHNGDFRALAEEEPGSFYLTDFLVRHFDRLVIQGLGLDRRPQLMPVYFSNYRRVVYLAQTESEKLQAMGRQQADFLGLDYSYRFYGDGPLTLLLKPELEQEVK